MKHAHKRDKNKRRRKSQVGYLNKTLKQSLAIKFYIPQKKRQVRDLK